VSPDASCFDASDDTAGFVPAVGEGPRNDANFLVALDADSETARASAGFWPASGEEASVKEDAPPALAPKPEKLPNFWGTPGCWGIVKDKWSGAKKRVGGIQWCLAGLRAQRQGFFAWEEHVSYKNSQSSNARRHEDHQ
jgi:hypothetical protein